MSGDAGQGPIPEQNLEQHESLVSEAIDREHLGDLQVVEDLLHCVLRGFNTLGSFTRTPANRGNLARLLLATRCFNSLRCAFWCVGAGYYSQSLALVRSAMEDTLTAWDCETRDETLAALLDGKGELGKGALTFAEMAKRVSPAFADAWTYNYGKLSEYAAHTRHMSVAHLVEPGSNLLRLGSYYDRELVLGTVDALLHALIQCADLMPRILEDRAKDWQVECFGAFKAANDWRAWVKQILGDAEAGTA